MQLLPWRARPSSIAWRFPRSPVTLVLWPSSGLCPTSLCDQLPPSSWQCSGSSRVTFSPDSSVPEGQVWHAGIDRLPSRFNVSNSWDCSALPGKAGCTAGPRHSPVALFIDSGLSLIAGSRFLAGPASAGGAGGWLTPQLPVNIPAASRAHAALLANELGKLLRRAWKTPAQVLCKQHRALPKAELRMSAIPGRCRSLRRRRGSHRSWRKEQTRSYRIRG